MKNNAQGKGRAREKIGLVAGKITNGVRENKTIIRWICLGGGVLSLLMLSVKYVLPIAEVYFGFTIFYMVSFFLYVGVKEWLRWFKIPYGQIKLGEWLGAVWLGVFASMVVVRLILSILSPELVKERFIVPEEVAWICIEILFFFALSGISKHLHEKLGDKSERENREAQS